MLFLLLACTGAAVIDDTGPTTDDTSADDTGTDDTGDTSDTSDTGDTSDDGALPYPTVSYDCSALPESYQEKVVEGARAYHGVAFDDQGNLIGWNSQNALVKAAYEEKATPWLPGMQEVEQIAQHPNGDLYVLARGQLNRVTPEGGSERIAGDFFYAYGVSFGPDGMLYVGDGGLHRVDPETGAKTTLIQGDPEGWTMVRAVTFSLDSTVMYVVYVGDSWVYSWDLDADLNPIGELEKYARIPGQWKDGIGIDACGYLWIPDYERSSLFRVSPDGGEVIKAQGGTPKTYAHGLSFGSGLGGWRQDALYLPMPYDNAKVRELVIGVPDGRLVRTWNGEKAKF